MAATRRYIATELHHNRNRKESKEFTVLIALKSFNLQVSIATVTFTDELQYINCHFGSADLELMYLLRVKHARYKVLMQIRHLLKLVRC